jgi:hypothetical protein
LQLDGEEPSITSHETIASPEGRFLRRRHSQLTADDDDDDDDDEFEDQESLGSLEHAIPEAYWKNPNLDDTVEVLESLEWNWIPYWKLDHLLDDDCDTANVPLWFDQITQRLSELDATHLRTCKRLYKYIQPHAKELDSANQAALDLAKNLHLCQMYLERSQQSIALAQNGSSNSNKNTREDGQEDGRGVQGARDLLGWWDTQESYQQMDGILQEMDQVYRVEEELIQRIENYSIRKTDSLEECHSILEQATQLQTRLEAPTMIRLECLNNLRQRASQVVSKTFMTRLHVWLESTTVRCCHPSTSGLFSSDEYSRLVQAMLQVGGGDQLHMSFCTSIQTALLLEAQKCFGMALLDPTDSENEASEYDQELLALSTNAYLDPSKMAIWTHNLVTIRFDFELQKNLLPAVFHRLCCLLTNVLHGQYCLMQWHAQEAYSKDDNQVLVSIHQELQKRRVSIWNSCVKVLEECLEEYLKFVGKKKLFEWQEEEHVDSVWMEDLEGLEDILRMTDQFLSLRREFLARVSVQFINDGSMLREKLYTIMKKHLRDFHVEGMNTMGLALYREPWDLVPLKSSKPNEANCDDVVAFIQQVSRRSTESFKT